MDFLLNNQEANGAWGSQRNAGIGIDEFWSNPETHRSWQVAVTGLGLLTMSEAGQSDAEARAYLRGVEFLINNAASIKRPSEWDTDNTWAYVYALQALAHACTRTEPNAPNRERFREIGQAMIQKLDETQTPNGGWGYYDFEVYAHPGSWATSFMTAVAVLALYDAKDVGLTVDPKRLEAAARAVERCRLPNGAYTYSVDAIPSPGRMEYINQVKGSLSRIPVCNLALLRAGRPVRQETLRAGLDQFFKEHKFLDIAFQKPIPHETYYYNSGYFYFFGHYYAAQVIALLPKEDQDRYWPQLQEHIVKTQESDGAMWDYPMNSYHRPYGTAFSMMALHRSLPKPDVAPQRPGPESLQPVPKP